MASRGSSISPQTGCGVWRWGREGPNDRRMGKRGEGEREDKSGCFPLPLEALPWAPENHTPDQWRDSLSLALFAFFFHYIHPLIKTVSGMEITWRVVNRGVGGGEGGKVQRRSSINGR